MPRAYTMTIGGVLAKARAMLNDARADTGYRDDDTSLVGSLNEAIKAMVPLVPGLFAEHVTHTCSTGARQLLENDRAVALLDIPGMPEGDLATLNAFAPGWTAGSTGATREFMRLPGEPLAFMTYPPAAADALLTVRAVLTPVDLEAGDLEAVIPVPEVYEPALVEYVAGRASLKDDEHVNSNRAAQLMERFAATVKSLAP